MKKLSRLAAPFALAVSLAGCASWESVAPQNMAGPSGTHTQTFGGSGNRVVQTVGECAIDVPQLRRYYNTTTLQYSEVQVGVQRLVGNYCYPGARVPRAVGDCWTTPVPRRNERYYEGGRIGGYVTTQYGNQRWLCHDSAAYTFVQYNP